MPKLTDSQRDRLADLRRWRDDPQLEHAVHPGNVRAFFREAVDLLDELLADDPQSGTEFYFLRDDGDDDEASWWIYVPRRDFWICFYGDGFATEDREDTEQTIAQAVAGTPPSYSIFEGFHEGIALIAKRFGIRS